MNILIVGTIQGDNGYEEEMLVKNISDYLQKKGHNVDYFLLPFTRDILALPEQILAYQMIDVSSADMLITVGFPACTITHNNKIIYILETIPLLHEYWDSEYGIIPNSQYSKIYNAVNELESKIFKEAKKVICGSQILCDDLKNRYSIKSNVLYYPNLFSFEYDYNKFKQENYCICETSLLPYQRIELLLDTFKNKNVCNLYLYIYKANEVYMNALEKQIEERQIKHKIHIIKQQVPDIVIENALACLSLDFNVRKIPGAVVRCLSLGTTVITCEDSGAITEYININKCGIIEKANSKLISKRIESLEVRGKHKESVISNNYETFMEELTIL